MIWIGTSGFQYAEWKSGFYPAKMSATKMLGFYSEQFNTTEINYTFRRLPSDKTIANWQAQTPAQFRFTLKALQRITDFQRLQNCEELTEAFVAAALKLETKLGALLFQLPPSFRCDVPVLNNFLDQLPKSIGAVFEFRHESWFRDAVYESLRRHNATLCIAESEKLRTPVVFTGTTAYFRLRCVDYSKKDLQRWVEIIRDERERREAIYVYFKHEDTGIGPKFATQLKELLAQQK